MPDFAETLLSLALGHLNARRLADAERLARRALEAVPESAAAHHLLANTLLEAGRPAEALPHAERATASAPSVWEPQAVLGLAHQRLGHPDLALPPMLRALALGSDHAIAWTNLSAALMDRRAEQAEACAARALDLDPTDAMAHNNLAKALMDWGEMREALAHLEVVIAADPTNRSARAGALYCADFLPETTGEQALASRRALAAAIPRKSHKLPQTPIKSPDPDRRLRVGYVSGDYYAHSAAYIWAPILRHHDRAAVEVVAYSDTLKPDAVTERIRGYIDRWVDIRGLSDHAIAERVRADRIDVLVDLSGYTACFHVPAFAERPAPVQVTAWGYLTGTGLPEMDAILADDVLIPPEHEAHFAERVVRLPYGLGFETPDEDVPIMSRPDRPLTFGYLGRVEKVTEATLDLWARVLRAYPESRLLLKCNRLERDRVWARLAVGWHRRGIARGRVICRGATTRRDHLAAYNDVDVALDPIPHGGGVTTLEALWMGKPLVTLLGPRIIGRISATTLHAIERDEWVAEDEDEYVRLAGTLSGQGGPGLRADLEGSIVCDGPRRARDVERAYRTLFREWCERCRGRG